MTNYYTLPTPEKQQELSRFSVHDTHNLYVNSKILTLAYECNNGMVTTIVCEKVGEQ